MDSESLPRVDQRRSIMSPFRNGLRPRGEQVDDMQGLGDSARPFDLEGIAVRDPADNRPERDRELLAASRARRSGTHHPGFRDQSRGRWQPQDDDEENEVPQSLLLEPNDSHGIHSPGTTQGDSGEHGVQARATTESRFGPAPPLEAARVYEANNSTEHLLPTSTSYQPPRVTLGAKISSARDKAAWRWVNVSNLDHFMLDVYNYYEGSGYWCILTDRGLHLL
jgi:autophagy-related protein 9